MIVFNATNEPQSVQAFGNWFTFKPKQFKVMTENLGHFLITNRSEDGFVGLPEAFEDPSYKDTPDGKVAYLAAEKLGIQNYLKKMHEIVDNNVRSLGRDLQMANIQTDPREFMSEGEFKALETLARYKDLEQDEMAKKAQKARELEEKLGLSKRK